jgi:hypothetical protein
MKPEITHAKAENMLAIATVLWKRLDTEGHDACRLVRRNDGWQVCGEAIFLHEGKPCSMRYDVRCDAAWRTRLATVNGWVGARELTCEIVRSEEATWLLNGVEQPQASGCVDVDLGFTPATNLLALRRFNLSIGEETPAPAAYLSFPELRLDLLEQTYRRTAETTYAYRAPIFSYIALLEVSESGFITRYPGLWEGRLFPDG